MWDRVAVMPRWFTIQPTWTPPCQIFGCRQSCGPQRNAPSGDSISYYDVPRAIFDFTINDHLFLLCGLRTQKSHFSITVVLIAACYPVACVGFAATYLSVFFHMISQKPMHLGSPNLRPTHRNVPQWVMEVHLFCGQNDKGQNHES